MIIITGGAGFIGSAIAWMLNGHGVSDIIIADTLGNNPHKWKNLRGLQFHDIWTPAYLQSQIAATSLPDVDTVIHMGACSATTQTDGDFLLENNYRFSQQLGQWALTHNKRFVYASSAAIYGNGSQGFADDPALLPHLRPLNMYGFSKQLFDLHVQRSGWYNQCVGLRFFNIFGPNEYHKGAMRSMVYKAAQQIKQSGEVALFKSTEPQYDHGDQERDFLYVKDAVGLIWDVLERQQVAGIFNIGSGIASTWNQLATCVFDAMAKPANIRYIEMPAELSGRYQSYTCSRTSSIRDAIGHQLKPPDFNRSIHDYVTNYLMADEPNHLDINDSTKEWS